MRQKGDKSTHKDHTLSPQGQDASRTPWPRSQNLTTNRGLRFTIYPHPFSLGILSFLHPKRGLSRLQDLPLGFRDHSTKSLLIN
ncbi:hypothetical protein HanPI659440_Chr04g0149131 [Helianthus annuus]|nr:hypothetical protein HanPI659440_Chr04g0149131 [Helianthus annuus]